MKIREISTVTMVNVSFSLKTLVNQKKFPKKDKIMHLGAEENFATYNPYAKYLSKKFDAADKNKFISLVISKNALRSPGELIVNENRPDR